jgi:DNA-binding CsgD family transcriptional regulator
MVFKKRGLSQEATELARHIYLTDQYSPLKIARLMGVTEDTVRYAVQSILRTRNFPTTLIEAIEGGNTYAPSLILMGFHPSSVQYYLKKHKANAKKTVQQKQKTRHL